MFVPACVLQRKSKSMLDAKRRQVDRNHDTCPAPQPVGSLARTLVQDMRIPRRSTCGRALIPQAGSHAWLLCGYLEMQSAVIASAAGLVHMLTYATVCGYLWRGMSHAQAYGTRRQGRSCSPLR